MSTQTRDIRMQVMWNRLISVVEEQAMTLLRTAGYAPVYETNVHHATLKAFAKERLRMVQEALQAGRATAAFAGEKLGLFICKAVKFKKVK